MWEAGIEQELIQPNIATKTQKWPTSKKIQSKEKNIR